ncbi:unnamed protein product [Arabidopsis halleri]
MDIDFDKQPSELAASSARTGPKARPRLIFNVHVSSGGVHCCMEPTDLHARADMAMFLHGPKTRDSEMLGDFVSPDIDETIYEDEGRLDLQSVNIIQEGASAYGQHTGKFQLKPRCHGNVIKGQNHGLNEASQPHCSTDDLGHISTNYRCPSIVNEAPRKEAFNTSTHANLQEENFPEVPQDMVSFLASLRMLNDYNFN